MRCLAVDDHPLIRDGTRVVLRDLDPAMEVLEAESLEQAFKVLESSACVDLILLDLELGDSHGIATLSALREWTEQHELAPRVVVVSAHCEVALVREVINGYGTGFIQKATPNAIFRHAISITLAGGVYIPEMVLRQMDGDSRTTQASGGASRALALTPRESEVAALLVQGYTYKRIARELERLDGKSISDHTVRAHVGNIAWKLGVTENAKAGVMAAIARLGLRFPRA